MTALQTLDLSRNQITTLPESLGNLKELLSLHLYYNRFTMLPSSLANLTALQKLYLADNRLNSASNPRPSTRVPD